MVAAENDVDPIMHLLYLTSYSFPLCSDISLQPFFSAIQLIMTMHIKFVL